MAAKKKSNGNGGMQKPAISREVVDRVRVEFMMQASYSKFRPYLETISFTDEEKLVYLEIASRENWNDEHASFSDALRRKVDSQIANQLTKMSLANVKSGRRKMIQAADNMMNVSETILKRALKKKLLHSKTGGQLPESQVTENYLRAQLAFIKSYGTVVEQAQKIWAGALGLADALQTSFPDDEYSGDIESPISEELQDMLKEFKQMQDEYNQAESDSN